MVRNNVLLLLLWFASLHYMWEIMSTIVTANGAM